MSKLEYNYTVHPDSEHDKDDKDLPTKVVASVSLTFDNPEYKPETTEKVTSKVVQFDKNGEFVTDKNGDHVYEEVEQEVVHPAEGKKQLTFLQDIFITDDKKKQDSEVKAYCEQYEKDYKELVSQPQ